MSFCGAFKIKAQHLFNLFIEDITQSIKLFPVSSDGSRVAAGSLNLTVLGVHLAQLCARLMMEGRVEDAQRQLSAQQRLLQQIRYESTIFILSTKHGTSPSFCFYTKNKSLWTRVIFPGGRTITRRIN